MIFYFSLLHGVHCTPVACYYTTDISTHHSLEASGKNAKSPSLLKGSTKYTKFLMYHPSVLGNQNDIQGCHREGSFHQLALRKIKTMKTQQYVINMRTSFQRHKFLVYLKDSMKNVLLYCLEDYSFVTHVYCKDRQAGNSRTL